jgi:hypothetical protein
LKTLEVVEQHEKQMTPLVEIQMYKTNLLITQVQIFIKDEEDEDKNIQLSMKNAV